MLRIVCMYAKLSHPRTKGTLLWPAAGRTAPQTPAGLSLQGNRRERWRPHRDLQRSVMHDCLAAWRGARHNGSGCRSARTNSRPCEARNPATQAPTYCYESQPHHKGGHRHCEQRGAQGCRRAVAVCRACRCYAGCHC